MAIASSGSGMMRGRRPFIRFPATCHWLPCTSPHFMPNTSLAYGAPHQGGVERWPLPPLCRPHMLNWWPQAGGQPIEQPCGDVPLILEPPVVIDLDGLIEKLPVISIQRILKTSAARGAPQTISMRSALAGIPFVEHRVA